MKVRMKLQISGNRDGVVWPPAGEVKELPDHEAARLCASGLAEPVTDEPEKRVEKAVVADRAEHRAAPKKKS
jgi:hypothetical protein